MAHHHNSNSVVATTPHAAGATTAAPRNLAMTATTGAGDPQLQPRVAPTCLQAVARAAATRAAATFAAATPAAATPAAVAAAVAMTGAEALILFGASGACVLAPCSLNAMHPADAAVLCQLNRGCCAKTNS